MNYGLHTKKYWLPLVIGICSIASLGAGYIWYWEYMPKDTLVEMYLSGNLPVVLVRTPHGKIIVFDGGNDAGVLREVNSLVPVYKKEIELVTQTSPFDKKTIGLIALAGRYTIKNFTQSSMVSSTTIQNTLQEDLVTRAVPSYTISEIKEFDIDEVHVLLVPTLHGLVTKISTGEISFLFTNESTAKEMHNDILNSLGSSTVLMLSHTDDARISKEMYESFSPEKIVYKKPNMKKISTTKAAPDSKKAAIKKISKTTKVNTKKSKEIAKDTEVKKVVAEVPKPPFSILSQKSAEVITLTATSKIIFTTEGSVLKRQR